MSVEQQKPYRMPQPEQWLSKHPLFFALIVVAVSVLWFVLFRWAA